METDHPPEAKDFIPLHDYDFQILLTVLAHGTVHPDGAAEAVFQIYEDTGVTTRKYYTPTFYRRFDKLAESGLIQHIPHPNDSTADSRTKQFSMTALGTQVVMLEITRLRLLLQHTENIGLLSE